MRSAAESSDLRRRWWLRTNIQILQKLRQKILSNCEGGKLGKGKALFQGRLIYIGYDLKC